VFLAMEYIGNGDLAQHIPSISTEDEVRQISRDLLFGLRIMHDEGFTHRDLKPQVCPKNYSQCLIILISKWINKKRELLII